MKNFLEVCADTAAARVRAATKRVKEDTPRDLGCQWNERASQKPFDGVPYTRLAAGHLGRKSDI
jgi:hypothetical protein